MHQDGYTALMRAARDGQAEMVTLLLYRGASVNLANKVGALSSVRSALWRTC